MNKLSVPDDYPTFTQDEKDMVLDKIIDSLIKIVDRELLMYPEINRVTYLINTLEELLKYHEQEENYECCILVQDLKRRINEC